MEILLTFCLVQKDAPLMIAPTNDDSTGSLFASLSLLPKSVWWNWTSFSSLSNGEKDQHTSNSWLKR